MDAQTHTLGDIQPADTHTQMDTRAGTPGYTDPGMDIQSGHKHPTQLTARTHSLGGGGRGENPHLGTQPTHTHLHTAPPMGARQPPRHTAEGAATRGDTHARPDTAPRLDTRHTPGWPHKQGAAHAGAGHTQGRASARRARRSAADTHSHARTLTPALTPAPPPAASPAAAGRAHPARGGPGPGPAAAASLRAMVGGGPGEGARCRGAASLPPPALPPEPPPSSALRAARRPSPAAATAARGEGAQTRGAGRGGRKPPTPAPGPPQTPLHCGAAGPPPTPPQPHLQPSRLPQRPPDHAPTGMGTLAAPTKTSDLVLIPRGTPDHVLPHLRTKTMFLSHPGPQTTSCSPWRPQTGPHTHQGP